MGTNNVKGTYNLSPPWLADTTSRVKVKQLGIIGIHSIVQQVGQESQPVICVVVAPYGGFVDWPT